MSLVESVLTVEGNMCATSRVRQNQMNDAERGKGSYHQEKLLLAMTRCIHSGVHSHRLCVTVGERAGRQAVIKLRPLQFEL